MTDLIEVRVPVGKAQENVIHTNMRVINELKQAGVPVLGATVLQGVSTGALTLWTDRDTNEHVYTWEPPITHDPINEDEDDEL